MNQFWLSRNAIITAFCLPAICLTATLLAYYIASFFSYKVADWIAVSGLRVSLISIFVSLLVILINVIALF